MIKHRLPLLGGLVAVIAVALAGVAMSASGSTGSHAQTARPRSGGSLVFGAEQEPPCLNGLLAGCNNTWTSWTAGLALPGAYRVAPDFSFQPVLVDRVDVTKNPFTLTYHIKKKAVWSDGKPVSANDFVYTLAATLNPKNDVAGRSGYDQIRRSVKLNAKTVRFVFKAPYAGWKTLFSSVYPQHVLKGTNFNEVWNSNYNNPKTGKPIGSGPFLVTNYTKGQSITLTRNPRWWGPHKPYLDRIVFKFVTNTDSEIQAIKGGEVDAIYPQPQLQLAGLGGVSGLTVQSHAGTSTEHIDFNAGPSGMQLARTPWFRQAVAYSIDRQTLVKQLFRTLNPKLGALDNLSYVNTQSEYRPHFQSYVYSPAKVARIMKSHGCAKGSDGIWTCNGVKASITFGTTAGNKLREMGQEVMQAQAKKAGIQLVIENSPSSVFFPNLSSLKYQMGMFAWVTSGDPAGQVDVYGCGGESNWKAYCSKKVTGLLRASDRELDPTKRAALVNKADAIMALNVPTIPLFQKPTYFVFNSKLHGAVDNPSLQGPTWNAENWWVG